VWVKAAAMAMLLGVGKICWILNAYPVGFKTSGNIGENPRSSCKRYNAA
jgi:hypothetical protein